MKYLVATKISIMHNESTYNGHFEAMMMVEAMVEAMVVVDPAVEALTAGAAMAEAPYKIIVLEGSQDSLLIIVIRL